MSRLVREIEQCMSGLTEVAGDEVTARFLFPTGFIGFQGHFPGNPVLPAVCKVQAAIAVLEAWSRRKVRLGEIVSAKFLAPVTSDEEIVVRCSVTMEEDGRGMVKAAVARNAESVAKFKLRVTLENGREGSHEGST
jgi:3-hydroxyacyl-[acyl-carrier-protein] dehydratase